MTPPNAADAAQTIAYIHHDAGSVRTVKPGVTVLATVTYDASGELAAATHMGGSSLASIGKNAAGQVVSQSWKTSDNVQVDSAVARTRASK